jgi:two-component system sensor kinase FixL
LRIVFGNLIRNAREAMPQGGRLAVTAREVPLAGAAGSEGPVAGAPGLWVAFADTGVGIPPDKLSQVMEPLYSTKARGLGLGLAIARAILEKNQGGLRVTSEVGRGSTFTVLLKAAPAKEGVP